MGFYPENINIKRLYPFSIKGYNNMWINETQYFQWGICYFTFPIFFNPFIHAGYKRTQAQSLHFIHIAENFLLKVLWILIIRIILIS